MQNTFTSFPSIYLFKSFISPYYHYYFHIRFRKTKILLLNHTHTVNILFSPLSTLRVKFFKTRK